MADERFVDFTLQAAYQAWMRGDRGGHLDDAAWLRLAAGDAVQSERDLLFAHIMTCADCSHIWRGLALLKHEAETQGLIERRPSARPSFIRSMFMPLAIAATLVAAIATVIVMRQPAPIDTVLRGTATLSPVDGLMMAYSNDGAPTLLWTPISGATTYRVEIFTEDGRPVWSGDASSPPLRWPSEVAPAKGAYRWRVEAQDSSGVIARSRLTPMELTR